jgi:hypothetical protein
VVELACFLPLRRCCHAATFFFSGSLERVSETAITIRRTDPILIDRRKKKRPAFSMADRNPLAKSDG